jgi:DNA primase
MARIKDSSVEAVKAAAEIVPLVEDYVRLRKAGGTYKGLCPFHQERTPSFTVTPARGTFKCFGCGEGGDAITFVEKMEQVDFIGAIESLAKRFGVAIEYEEISPEAEQARRRKERLGQLLERATSFYERLLWDSEQGVFAREYLASRGLDQAVCRQFRLGYAPGGPMLARRALQEGYAQDELLAAGLANRRGNDYFSHRLLFPLADARGSVRGFQARKLHDDDPLQAKYVNSPESDLFKKGDLLYGLDSGRQAIAKQDRAVVVEGNTDVLALRQAGFEPVVASMGTALTERQLRELNRLTKRLFLCFDADAAGQDATLRGMELAVSQGFDVQVVALPAGMDPADDPDVFQQRLTTSRSYERHRVRAIVTQSAGNKDKALSEIRKLVGRLPREHPNWLDAIRDAADLLDLPPEVFQTVPARSDTKPETPEMLPRDPGTRLEQSALAGAVAHDELIPMLAELKPDDFDHQVHRRVRNHLVDKTHADDELAGVLAELEARASFEAIDAITGRQLLLRLTERRLERQIAKASPEGLAPLQKRLADLRNAIREFA